MDGDNHEAIYCEEDRDYRVYCDICDKLCIERFHKNHLKLSIHTKINLKRENKIQQAYKN